MNVYERLHNQSKFKNQKKIVSAKGSSISEIQYKFNNTLQKPCDYGPKINSNIFSIYKISITIIDDMNFGSLLYLKGIKKIEEKRSFYLLFKIFISYFIIY